MGGNVKAKELVIKINFASRLFEGYISVKALEGNENTAHKLK